MCVCIAVTGETKVLFVKNLNFKTTKETILSHFEGAKVVRLATLPDSKKSRGYGQGHVLNRSERY